MGKREEVERLTERWEQVASEIYEFGLDSRLEIEDSDVFLETADCIGKVISKMILTEGYAK